MVNRNAGSGTRIIIDKLLGTQRPAGTAPRRNRTTPSLRPSRGRADWGIAIDTVAREYGLDFVPLQEGNTVS